MASIKLLHTRNGSPFYQITVSRGRELAQLTKRWYPAPEWSARTVSRELAKAAAEFEAEVKSGQVISRKEKAAQDADRAAVEAAEREKIQTLKQYGEQVFMPSLTIRVSENTRCSYQGNLNHWIYPAMGDINLEDVSAAEITSLLTSMQAGGLKQATCVKVYVVLSGLFKMAYMTDVIKRNPMDKVERPKARKDEVKQGVESYTVEEVQEILSALENEPLRWRVFVLILIDTGIRRGECCALQWKDIDFTTNKITISGNLCYTPQKGVYLDTTKNGETRVVDVAPDIMALLKMYRHQQTVLSPWVFCQDNGQPIHPQSPTWYFTKFGKKYGIENFHPHKLRHTWASLSITAGADIASVSEKLGHKDKSTTLRMYTHADEDSMKRASDIFRNAIKSASQN